MAKAYGTKKTVLPDGADVDLSEKGVEEACKAGDALREAGSSFEAAYTSYLKRAVKTLNVSWTGWMKTGFRFERPGG